MNYDKKQDLNAPVNSAGADGGSKLHSNNNTSMKHSNNLNNNKLKIQRAKSSNFSHGG